VSRDRDGTHAALAFVVGAAGSCSPRLYGLSYRDEAVRLAFVKVALMIGAVVAIVFVFGRLVGCSARSGAAYVGLAVVGRVVGYLLFKMCPKLAIMKEVYGSFVRAATGTCSRC
jgi:hypothetical protein